MAAKKASIEKRLTELEAAATPQDENKITVYLVGEDGTRMKAHPETPGEQAIYNQWVADATARADEITKQDLIKRGIIQPGDDWQPGRGVIRK